MVNGLGSVFRGLLLRGWFFDVSFGLVGGACPDQGVRVIGGHGCMCGILGFE